MLFGSTKRLVAQYEQRIADLQGQIKDLRSLVFSPTSSGHIPLVALEADAILSQKETTIHLSNEEISQREADVREAELILSGNY